MLQTNLSFNIVWIARIGTLYLFNVPFLIGTQRHVLQDVPIYIEIIYIEIKMYFLRIFLMRSELDPRTDGKDGFFHLAGASGT